MAMATSRAQNPEEWTWHSEEGELGSGSGRSAESPLFAVVEQFSRRTLEFSKGVGRAGGWNHPPHPLFLGPLGPWTEHKVIIVGLDNAGKTTILYQFLTNEVVHTCLTISSKVEEIIPRKTHFLMWDLVGQEALHSTWITYYSNTEFSIFVIDSTDRNWLLTAWAELYKMLAHKRLLWTVRLTPSSQLVAEKLNCIPWIPADSTAE
ncbi:putative ADP-ribosylation factor-like protein 5C [Sapajus apella]|uniref:ADP-ribosylation factor-like protein 5C n=1 Tax=Sapajus apella TaxID=9515 RepID=A0A6J3HXU6_SAPAP|nr:putative ADP-ribosylation factor-like protein 5C [Sapajus apella]